MFGQWSNGQFGDPALMRTLTLCSTPICVSLCVVFTKIQGFTYYLCTYVLGLGTHLPVQWKLSFKDILGTLISRSCYKSFLNSEVTQFTTVLHYDK